VRITPEGLKVRWVQTETGMVLFVVPFHEVERDMETTLLRAGAASGRCGEQAHRDTLSCDSTAPIVELTRNRTHWCAPTLTHRVRF
jgi:hypothetical protein